MLALPRSNVPVCKKQDADPTDPTDLLSVSRPCKVRVKSVWVVGNQSAPSFFVPFVVKKLLDGDEIDISQICCLQQRSLAVLNTCYRNIVPICQLYTSFLVTYQLQQKSKSR